MIEKETANKLLSAVDEVLSLPEPLEARLQGVMQLLHDGLSHYHWVGIYWLHGDMLILGPFVGPPTDHTQIPVGRGVCGTAVAENTNQIIEDVRALDNYLACNLETRSEIVVLMRDSRGEIIGQIDVDGTEVGSFDKTDEVFLEEVANRLVQVWGLKRV